MLSNRLVVNVLTYSSSLFGGRGVTKPLSMQNVTWFGDGGAISCHCIWGEN
jgi:hypothetical protein